MTSDLTRSTRPRRSRALVLLCAGAALSLGLTSCGSGSDEPGEELTRATTAASATESATESATPSASPAETPSASASPNTSAPAASSAPATSSAPAASIAATTSTSASATPTATASRSATATATAAPAEAQTTELSVYWVAEGDGGATGTMIGCGDSLIQGTASAEDAGQIGEASRVEAAIEALLEHREREVGQSGLINALYQSELSVEDATVQGDSVTVELSGQPMSAGTCATPQIIEQLESTAAANAGTNAAEVLIDGTPIQEFMSQAGG